MAAHAAGCSFLFPSAEVKEEGKLLRQQDGQVVKSNAKSYFFDVIFVHYVVVMLLISV